MSWWSQAACVGTPTDVFFPPMGGPGSNTQAKRICAACPVNVECLDDAIRNEPMPRAGIYAGTTPAERDAIAQGAK